MIRALYLCVFVGLLLCTCALPAADFQLTGQVTRVVDGDSLELDVRGTRYRIELADIDAPEINQPWGAVAADELRKAAVGRFAVVAQSTLGQGNVMTGRVEIGDRDIALDLLYAGLTWTTLPPTDPAIEYAHPYPAAEQEARLAHKGLWSDDKPVPPWEWRKHAHPVPANRW